MDKIRYSGVAWLGDIPDRWEVSFLAQVVSQVKERNDGLREKNLLSLSYGKIKRKPIDTIGGLLPATFDGYNVIDANDIVLRLTDLQNDQHSLRVGLSHERGIITSAYITLRPSKRVNASSLFYLLYAFDIRKGFYGMGAGVRQSLKYDEVKVLPIVLPPLPEQRAIADYLDEKCGAIDAAIAEAKKGIEEYKAWKKSLIFEAVTGKRRVGAFNAKTQSRREAEKMKHSGIPWIGAIPEGWKVRRLKGVLARPLQYGASESGVAYDEALPRYIRITDITLGGKLKDEGALSLTEESALDYILQDCDILLARSGATVGKAFLYEKQMGRAAFAGYLIRATVDVAKALPRFVYYTTLGCGYDDWRNSIAVSATIQNIGADKYNNYSLPMPSIEEQQAIADYLDEKCTAIDAMVAEKEALIADLEVYKKSLIYEVVTGKREVA